MSNTQNKITILVVDDQPENIDVLSNILRTDYKVKAAINGEKALQIIQQKEAPDLILLDIMMPGIDGYEVCRRLKEDDHSREIPVIFVSALQNIDDRLKAFTAGGVDYLTKPVQPEEVRARVKAQVQLKMMQQQLIQANNDLEQRVKERTLEVETAYSELHESYKQIVESEVKYRWLLEAAPDAVILINEDGKIEIINEETRRMFAYSDDELLGHEIDILIPSKFATHISLQINSLKQADTRQPIKNSTLRAQRKDGTDFPIDISLNPIETNEGIKILFYIRDITEREQLYAQLQQAQKMEAIGHLTGGIAHDFNNLLASIMGFTQLAIELSEEFEDKKLDEYLQEVNLAGERARDLIAQMLSFSRRSNPKELLPLELPLLIKEVTNLLRPMLPSSIEINYKIEHAIPKVKADPVKIHQVLMNLCINARDALQGHGKIDLNMKSTALDGVTCSSCHKLITGEFIEIVIKDNGSGIEQQYQNMIFDPFFTTKDIGKGTGMGLSVVHGIMHDHHGHILLNSTTDKGTEFHLIFPKTSEM